MLYKKNEFHGSVIGSLYLARNCMGERARRAAPSPVPCCRDFFHAGFCSCGLETQRQSSEEAKIQYNPVLGCIKVQIMRIVELGTGTTNQQ